MRNVIGRTVWVIAAAALAGCGSNATTKPSAAGPMAGSACVMRSGGADVLALTVPPGTKVDASKDGQLAVGLPLRAVNVWLAADAATVDAGVATAGKRIVGEFLNFTPTQTTDLTVAGKPAKRLYGGGNEADDQDAGFADVVVFQVGDHVFVGCVHGEPEELTPEARAAMAALVQTARLP